MDFGIFGFLVLVLFDLHICGFYMKPLMKFNSRLVRNAECENENVCGVCEYVRK